MQSRFLFVTTLYCGLFCAAIAQGQPVLRLKVPAPAAERPSSASEPATRGSANPGGTARAAAGEVQTLTPPGGARAGHLIVQFSAIPGDQQRQALTALGARVLSYVPDNGFLLWLDRDISVAGLGIVAAAPLASESKISPLVTALTGAIPSDDPGKSFPRGAPRAGATQDGVYLIVEFHPDVDLNAARALLLNEGLTLHEHPDLGPGRLMIRLGDDPQALADIATRLAADDEIAYVFPASADLIEGRQVFRCFDTTTYAQDPNGPHVAFSVGQYIATVGEGWDGPGRNPATVGYVWGTPTSKLALGTAHTQILNAMQKWAEVVDLTWTEGSNLSANKTLAIHFYSGSHGDGNAFDGPWGILAHAYYPAPPNPEPIAGDMHFDEAESWNVGSHVDLFSVALHELGHSLGLGHSDDSTAVMYPYYAITTGLKSDDINTVKTLYAEANPAQSDPPPPVPQPSMVSVSPHTSSGSAANFTFTFAEATAASNLTGVAMLFNTSTSGANSCQIVYDVNYGSIYLSWDSGNGANGKPIASTKVLSNSQCSVGTVDLTLNGTQMTLTVPVTFHSGFNGSKNIYMAAAAGSVYTGWAQRGSYTVVTGGAPVAQSASPNSGSGSANQFTFTISEASGASYLTGAGILFQTSLNGVNACYVVYDRPTAKVWLVYDSTNGASPVTPGASTTVGNSQCRLYGAGTSVSIGATSITITVSLSFDPSFAGTKNIFLIATENGANSGWQNMGSWTVPGDVPVIGSVSPTTGSGYGGTFVVNVNGNGGTNTITGTSLLFTTGAATNTVNACRVVYDRPNGTIGLYDDAGTVLSTKPMGSSANLQNSQCAIGYAVMTKSGNTLSLSVYVLMKPAFSGTKTVYAAATTTTADSGFSSFATYTVP